MSPWRAVTAGFRSLFNRRSVERDLDDELRHYLELAAAENVRRGMSRKDAERAARIAMGGVEQARSHARWGGWEASLEWLTQDARVAARGLRRAPAFTTVAVVSLALGVGAVTTMFSVVNAVIFRPLPYHDADRLVMIWTDDARRGLHRENTAWLTIEDWRSRNAAFDDVAYFSAGRVNPVSTDPMRGRGRTRGAFVSGNLFALLGATPLHGRLVSAADERQDVAVISHAFWQDWFGGDTSVVGKTLTVDDAGRGGLAAFTVIGVLPQEFWFPDRGTSVFIPAGAHAQFDRDRAERFQSSARRWTAVARLNANATPESARDDLNRIGRQLGAVYTTAVSDFPGFATTVTPVLDTVAGDNLRSALWLLLGAVGVVLIVVCANLANLLLARGTTRQREFAIRRALGAGRRRLVRQLVVEGLLLVLVGGATGALLASWATPLLGKAISAYVPRMDEIAFDSRVLLFTIGSALLAGVLFGTAPALRLSGARGDEALRGAKASRGRSGRRSQGMMVFVECALAMVLLTAAGLLIRSLAKVAAVDPGFDPSGVLALRLEFPASGEEENRRDGDPRVAASTRAQSAASLADRVARVPGVTTVGFIDDMFVSSQGNESVTIPGRDPVAGELAEALVTPGFFEAMRVSLVLGRLPDREDAARRIQARYAPEARSVTLAEPAVVNEAFVRRFFPAEDPLGKRFVVNPANRARWYEIVGVTGNMRRSGPERAPIPEYYAVWIPSPGGRVDLVVRTDGDALAVAPLIRQAVNQEMPSISIVNIATVEQQLGAFTAQRRMQTTMLALFAGIAVLLAAIGIFGLAHYAVAERTREIGVRMALGATPAGIRRMMMSEGMRMPLVGIAIGIVVSLAGGRVLESQLFGVTRADVPTFAIVAGLLALVAAVACASAANRATRTDPVVALKTD